MEARIKVGSFGGRVEVGDGEAVIKSEGYSNFSVVLSGMKDDFSQKKGIKEIQLLPQTGGFRLAIDLEDGRVICINNDVYNDGLLVVSRFRREGSTPPEYLTKDMEWMSVGSERGPLPEGALRIDLFGFTGEIRTGKR